MAKIKFNINIKIQFFILFVKLIKTRIREIKKINKNLFNRFIWFPIKESQIADFKIFHNLQFIIHNYYYLCTLN